MSEQPSGLRFDIYERVQLPEQLSAIHQLNEVELTPQIRVGVEGEYAVVKGHLLMTGTYSVSDDERSTGALRHEIPVEITLPMSRVRNVEDLIVTIDNFDIDLLSPRSLNVTGVLSLHGVDFDEAQTAWNENDEVVFVHQAHGAEQADSHDFTDGGLEPESGRAGEAEANAASAESFERHESESYFAQEEIPVTANAGESGENGNDPPMPDRETERNEFVQEAYEDLKPPKEPGLSEGDKTEAEPKNIPDVSTSDGEAVSAASSAEENQEMKISFGSKNDSVAPQPFDLKSILSKADSHPEEFREWNAALEVAPEPAPDTGESPFEETAEAVSSSLSSRPSPAMPEPEPSSADTLEWKKLFLASGEQTSFRRIRICIVQKDETLETIAQKYGCKPQQLRLYNRLSDADVSEGQLLYIP